MRRLILTGVVLLLFSVISCKKEESNNNNNNNDIVGSQIKVTGKFDAKSADVTSVWAISSTNSTKQATVSSSQFTLDLDNGKPWGLIFLNSNNQYVGRLSLENGIETLPLQYIKAAGTLDLGVLDRVDSVFIPSHNPIGNEIILSADQLKLLKISDDFMKSVIQNKDVDNNGKLDIIENKFYKLSILYFAHPGRFEKNSIKLYATNAKLITGYRLNLTVKDAGFPEKVIFTGPVGSPLQNTSSESYLTFTDHRVYGTEFIHDPSSSKSILPPGGKYQIKYNNMDLTFYLEDQSKVPLNLIYPWPAVTLNADGTINKVDWEYQVPTGAINDDLSGIMRNVSLYIEGAGNKCSNHQYNSMLYTEDRMPISTKSHILKCQNIEWGFEKNGQPLTLWNHIERMGLSYESHYGLTYIVQYERDY